MSKLPIQFEWHGPSPTTHPDRVLVPISTPGVNGLSSISDGTDLGTLTNIADPAFLLVGRADGLKTRQLALAAIHRAILAAADAAGVRSALGLGNSATRNVGSGAGTVAAGDDPRFPAVPPLVTALVFG